MTSPRPTHTMTMTPDLPAAQQFAIAGFKFDTSQTYLVEHRKEYAIKLQSGELSRPMDSLQQARMALLQSSLMAQDEPLYEDAEVVERTVGILTTYTDWGYACPPPSPHL